MCSCSLSFQENLENLGGEQLSLSCFPPLLFIIKKKERGNILCLLSLLLMERCFMPGNIMQNR